MTSNHQNLADIARRLTEIRAGNAVDSAGSRLAARRADLAERLMSAQQVLEVARAALSAAQTDLEIGLSNGARVVDEKRLRRHREESGTAEVARDLMAGAVRQLDAQIVAHSRTASQRLTAQLEPLCHDLVMLLAQQLSAARETDRLLTEVHDLVIGLAGDPSAPIRSGYGANLEPHFHFWATRPNVAVILAGA